MFSTAAKTLSSIDRETVDKILDRVTAELPDFDLSPKAKRAVSILGATGLTTETLKSFGRSAGRRSSRLARQTGSYVAANPRNVGLGVGGTVVAGVGLYFLYKAFRSLPTEDTALLPAPEDIPEAESV